MDNPRVNISFKNTIEDIKLYDYLQTKRSKSCYLKDLIEKDMLKDNKGQY